MESIIPPLCSSKFPMKLISWGMLVFLVLTNLCQPVYSIFHGTKNLITEMDLFGDAHESEWSPFPEICHTSYNDET